MKLLHTTRIRIGIRAVFVSAASVLFCGQFVISQAPARVSIQSTTQERIETEPWWPTMSSFPLKAFAGSKSCAQCHQEETAHASTSMQRAAIVATDPTFLSGKPALTAKAQKLSYYLASSTEGLQYSVSDGAHKLSRRLDWVMGAGDLGRTFLYQADGHWFQSEMTFYTNPSALDITTGLPPASEPSLASALGQALSPDDARRCFSCHTVHATTPAGFEPLHSEAGLGCEACHGPGAAHVRGMAEASHSSGGGGSHAAAGASAIFNPAALSPVDSIDFCGACHRTFVDATLSMGPTVTTAVVRFQPYRLEESKCWRATEDARLTCTACHNPHEALNRNPVSYDKGCTQCHTAAHSSTSVEHLAKVCPKATSQCVTCHMPKVNVPSMHGDFTDHDIRIVRPGEGFPG